MRNLETDIRHLLDNPALFQQLTEEDLAIYGKPDLCLLMPSLIEDADCNLKRQNWIDWRAAPYPAERHSEYMFNPERDMGGNGPRILLSAIMAAPSNMESYLAGIHKDKRYTIRGRKAENRGYIAKDIAPAEFSSDIFDIIHSTDERQGRQIAAMFANRPRDWHFPEYSGFNHPEYEDICLGVFHPDGKLVAYLLGKRVGHHIQYDEIMGHAEHISSDVMHLLHFSFLTICSEQEVIPTCLNYGPWYSGENPYSPLGGLNAWKRRVGFRPAYLILASS